MIASRRDRVLAPDSKGKVLVTERCDLLVVAAFAPELSGFDALLGGAMRAEVRGLVIVARPVGIGLVEAAVGTAVQLEALAPRAAVLVGTCGAYPGAGLSIGDLVASKSTFLVEPAVVEGRAALPDPMSARLDAHALMISSLAANGARAADFATTLAITTDDELAARLAAHAAVEHLEAFAVATACAAKGVPFAAVLGVANSVGSHGRAEWRAHHATAGLAASSHVARWILAGAAGLPGT
jgi:futalosine hydrolase